MDNGRRTSSIIEKFVYDATAQKLNVSFQDLEYNIENGEMGFFEKEGDICYVSKLEIAPSGEKPYTVKFTNGDVFGSATVDGAFEFIKNEGGGGGGGGNIVLTATFDEEENITLTGASFDEIASGIKDDRLVVYRYADEEHESYVTVPIMSAFFDDAQDLYTLQIDTSGDFKVYALNRTDTTWTSVQPTPPSE